MNKVRKRALALILIPILMGCGADQEQNREVSEEQIVLEEPVGVALRYQKAAFREISVISTYPGVLCPDTTEYSYESEEPFGNYCLLPGDTVSAGDMLFYGNTDGIDDAIADVTEENEDLAEEYGDYMTDYAVDLGRAKKAEYKASAAYQELYNKAPEEDSPYYSAWAKGVMPAEKQYKQEKLAREKLEQDCLEHGELFDLTYAYNEKRISRLMDHKKEAEAFSSSDGVVVAANYYRSGDQVPVGSDIIAVGDPSKKEIRCEYVSKSTVNKALEIYAVIDGKRYEVQYENMEPEEYRRLKQKDEVVYTTFYLSEEGSDLPLGKYAMIVVVEQSIPNALCVPKGAVYKDEAGSFVYLYDNGDSVYTPVKTGMSDGEYTEILSGLKEGDPVVYEPPYDPGTKTARIETGSVSTEFQADGYLFYPSAEWMVNPAKNGVAYLKEVLVENYEQVTEGQVLARIEVVADNVEIGRVSRKIQRQNERLLDLYALKKDTYNQDELEAIDRAIRGRERTVEDLKERLDKLSRYSGVCEIRSPYNGIVTEVPDRKAGELIGYRDRILQVASDDSCYIIVEDQGGMLSYGDPVTVTYKDREGKSSSFEGTTVTLSPMGLSKSMRTGYALVKVSQEDMTNATSVGSDYSNGYWNRVRFSVRATVKSMDHVVLVPKNAVYKTGNDTYVMVKDEEGSTGLVKFTAGGSDNANYWVAYGSITEGMEICLG